MGREGRDLAADHRCRPVACRRQAPRSKHGFWCVAPYRTHSSAVKWLASVRVQDVKVTPGIFPTKEEAAAAADAARLATVPAEVCQARLNFEESLELFRGKYRVS